MPKNKYKPIKPINYQIQQPMADYIREDLQMYPHAQDPKVKNDNRYDKNSYISVQTKVNSDPVFETKYINSLAQSGWVAIANLKDIKKLNKGRMFKYRLNGDSMSGVEDGTFRSGGWFIGKNENDPDNNENYILYKGFNGAIFSLQLKDLKEVYIKSEKRNIPVFKKPDYDNPTNFPVYLVEPETGEDVIVYFGKDNHNKYRFMNSEKYKTALQTGYWKWSVVFNEEF